MTSDARPLVIQAYDGHPSYSCSKCSAVIVGISFLLHYYQLSIVLFISHYKTNSSVNRFPVAMAEASKYLCLSEHYSCLTGSELDAVGHQRHTRAQRGSFAFVRFLAGIIFPVKLAYLFIT